MSEAMILTNTVLKGIMTDAVVSRSKVLQGSDLDLITQAGVYFVDGSGDTILNSPNGKKQGILLVYRFDTTILQVFFTLAEGYGIAYRINWYSIGWKEWQLMANSNPAK